MNVAVTSGSWTLKESNSEVVESALVAVKVLEGFNSLLVKKTGVSSSSSSSWLDTDLAGAARVGAFLEVVRCLFAGCSSSARRGEADSVVVERSRRLLLVAGAGVDAIAFCRVAGCASADASAVGVVTRFALVVFFVFVEVAAVVVAALRGVARVRLLRVSIVTTSSVTSTAAARRVRRVDIALG